MHVVHGPYCGCRTMRMDHLSVSIGLLESLFDLLYGDLEDALAPSAVPVRAFTSCAVGCIMFQWYHTYRLYTWSLRRLRSGSTTLGVPRLRSFDPLVLSYEILRDMAPIMNVDAVRGP